MSLFLTDFTFVMKLISLEELLNCYTVVNHYFKLMTHAWCCYELWFGLNANKMNR